LPISLYFELTCATPVQRAPVLLHDTHVCQVHERRSAVLGHVITCLTHSSVRVLSMSQLVCIS